MPITTFLHSGELDQLTGRPELDGALKKRDNLLV